MTSDLFRAQIQRQRTSIFQQHPRAVDIEFEEKWYPAIRVAVLREDVTMMFDGYNPDTDTIYKLNLDVFVDPATGAPVPAPKRLAEINADNINWRVESTVREDNEVTLHCRKRLTTA